MKAKFYKPRPPALVRTRPAGDTRIVSFVHF